MIPSLVVSISNGFEVGFLGKDTLVSAHVNQMELLLYILNLRTYVYAKFWNSSYVWIRWRHFCTSAMNAWSNCSESVPGTRQTQSPDNRLAKSQISSVRNVFFAGFTNTSTLFRKKLRSSSIFDVMCRNSIFLRFDSISLHSSLAYTSILISNEVF